MPYIKEVCKAGDTIEVRKYYSSRYKKKDIPRSKNTNPTPEQQKKVNTRLAEQKLRRIINANFTEGDFHIDFGYIQRASDVTVTPDEMKKTSAKFLRYLRKEFKKTGKVLKYVHVMEVGTKGSRHHHFILPQMNTKIIQDCWNKAYPKKSTIHFTPLDESGDYCRLASYFIKYSDKVLGTAFALQGKRWSESRNMFHPIPKKEIVSADSWREEPKALKGYYIKKDSIEAGIHELTGYMYQSYTMIRKRE